MKKEEIFFIMRVVKHCNRFPREVGIPGNIQGQAGRDSEQSDLAEDVPAHCRGVRLDSL